MKLASVRMAWHPMRHSCQNHFACDNHHRLLVDAHLYIEFRLHQTVFRNQKNEISINCITFGSTYLFLSVCERDSSWLIVGTITNAPALHSISFWAVRSWCESLIKWLKWWLVRINAFNWIPCIEFIIQSISIWWTRTRRHLKLWRKMFYIRFEW